MRLLTATAALLVASLSKGFNLEPRVAIVKEGEPGSFFGFSVAQHQIAYDTNDRIESTLLVGAPLDRHFKRNRDEGDGPGALWKCPLTSRPDDCSRILADPLMSRSPRRRGRQRQHGKSEQDGQWLGSVVQSQGPGKKRMHDSAVSFIIIFPFKLPRTTNRMDKIMNSSFSR